MLSKLLVISSHMEPACSGTDSASSRLASHFCDQAFLSALFHQLTLCHGNTSAWLWKASFMWARALRSVQSNSIEPDRPLLHSHCGWTHLSYPALIELRWRMDCLCEGGPVPSCSVYYAGALKGIGKGSRLSKEEGLADNSCSIQIG